MLVMFGVEEKNIVEELEGENTEVNGEDDGKA